MSVQSPCVQICQVNDSMCIGCGRTLSEIREYGSVDQDRRYQINEAAAARLVNTGNSPKSET